MTCQEAEHLVTPYINHTLTDEQLEEFLEHIESCEACREELEIYFIVDVGIRQLDSGTGAYDIKGALETALELSRQRLYKIKLWNMVRYAVNTLCAMSLLVTLFLQMRIWITRGIF